MAGATAAAVLTAVGSAVAGSVVSSALAPDAPKAPEVPTAPSRTADSVQRAAGTERRRRLAGRASTLLTGPSGVTQRENVAKTKLLGG